MVNYLMLPLEFFNKLYRMEPNTSGWDVATLLSKINSDRELNQGSGEWRLPTIDEALELRNAGLVEIDKTVWTSSKIRNGFKTLQMANGYVGTFFPHSYLSVLPVRR